MSVLIAICTQLKANTSVTALTSNRIYKHEAPSSANLPYVTCYQISGPHAHHMTAAAGMTNPRVQIDSWDSTETGADTLADKIRLALDGFRGTMGTLSVRMCHLDDEGTDFFDKAQSAREGGIFRKRQDYRIWHTESVPTF